MPEIEPELGDVQETLLIPLYGRARDAAARRPILGDRRARKLVDAIDYDFAKFKGSSLPGTVLRTSMFDAWVRRFIEENPTGTVVEIGAGLNTRLDRVDNGHVRWFDLDLPDSIALRRRFFDDDERRTTVAGSVLKTDWFDAIAATTGPYFFVCEAVLIYLSAEQVRKAVAQLAARFPGAHLAFDTGGAVMIDGQERNRVMKPISARMTWVCEDPRQLEPWGLRLLESRTFAQPQPEVAASWPLRYRYGMPLMARLARSKVDTYKLNLFELAGTP